MKSCELCKSAAKVYCDSDQARLCWTCDRNVHSANFLVARHSRSLLCCRCQSPTQWAASGEKLGTSVASTCEKCVICGVSEDDVGVEESQGGNDVEAPPPAASSCSSSSGDCCSVGDGGGLMKRKRENDDVDCLSVQKHHRKVYEGNRGTLYHFLPLKSEAMGEKPKSIQVSSENKSEPVVRVCNGTRTIALDLNASGC